MTVKTMLRVFSFNGLKLPDPDPKLSVDEVRGVFAHAYPEIATATGLIASTPGNPCRCPMR